MLCPGMIVRTRDGRTVMLMGRNSGTLRWEWWGHRLKPNGKPDTDTMPVVAEKDVVAVKKKSGGFQGILPGIFG